MATSNAADRPGSSATGGEASPPNGPLPEAYVVRSFSRPLISTRMPVMAIPLSKSLIDAVEVGDNITCKFMARANKWGNTSQFGEAEVRISAKGEELEVERGLSGLSSLQGLCNTCARFLTSENWAKGSYEGPLRVFAKVFVSYFGHLAVASAQNCRICRVIVAEMVKARGPLAANEEIEVEYWIHSTLPHWHLRVFPRIRGEAYHLAVCRFHLWGEPIRQLNSPFSSGSAYSLSLTSSSFGTTSMARKWLQSCVHNHTACKRKRDSSWVPPRLLDLSRRNIRLVCFEDEEATKKPYAALSYCWGSDPNVFTLTASNLDAFRTGLPEDKLATAIKEAIQLCRSLSFDYLWVDSLCIIQSGKGSKEDWLRHAREMQFVYANCLLCISSSRAPNPSESMFAERDPAAWIQPTVETSGKKFTLLDEHGFRQRRRLAPTAKRGWILQERMMAPRVLSFETEQVFWDCEELQNACETFTTGPPCSLETDAIPFSLPDAVSEEDGHKMWLSIVEEYTGRALSRPDDDKLLALTAVAQQMSKLLDDQYVAGMFLKRLWLFLDAKAAEQVAGRAPSWSWASFDGQIYPFLGKFNQYKPHESFKVMGVDINLVDILNPHGQILSGKLRMQVVLASLAIPLVGSDGQSIYIKGRYDFCECIVNGIKPIEKEEEGVINIDPPRARPGWITKGVQEGVLRLSLALICEVASRGGVHGLLLAPTGSGEDGPAEYARAGTWWTDGSIPATSRIFEGLSSSTVVLV